MRTTEFYLGGNTDLTLGGGLDNYFGILIFFTAKKLYFLHFSREVLASNVRVASIMLSIDEQHWYRYR